MVPWPFLSCSQSESSTSGSGDPLLSASSPAQRDMSVHSWWRLTWASMSQRDGKKRSKTKSQNKCVMWEARLSVHLKVNAGGRVGPSYAPPSWSIRWSWKFSLQPCSLAAFLLVPADTSANGGSDDVVNWTALLHCQTLSQRSLTVCSVANGTGKALCSLLTNSFAEAF